MLGISKCFRKESFYGMLCYGMLCYAILWYGKESMVCCEISMICYDIFMLCYAMLYVAKDKHSTTVPYFTYFLKNIQGRQVCPMNQA